MPQAQTQTQDTPATKSIEFEGTTHTFPADFSDADISKALASYGKPKTAAPATSKLPPPPSADDESGWGGTYKKLGRGAALGAAAGAGIPESTSSMDVVTGALGNAAGGLYDAGKAILKDPIHGTGQVIDNMASNIESSGGEAWQGLKERDPEKFAHGFASAVTQILTLRSGEKAGVAKVGERTRLAKTATAINAGADEAAQLKTAMPAIVDQAKGAGIDTVGEFAKTVKDAKDAVDQQFNQGLAPIANKPYVPIEISRRIKNLITPDMAKTAEGRMQIKEINARAREYEKPWTINELNAKRMTENNNLKSYFNKDTRGQAASKLDMDISKAVRDGAADVVYNQWDQANPGQGAADLKAKQGALWGLADHLDDQLRDLAAKQLQHEGHGPLGRVRTHVYGSGAGVHGYLSGVGEAFGPRPEAGANKTMSRAFSPSPMSRAMRIGLATLPIDHLMSPPPVRNTPFAPPPTSDEQ